MEEQAARQERATAEPEAVTASAEEGSREDESGNDESSGGASEPGRATRSPKASSGRSPRRRSPGSTDSEEIEWRFDASDGLEGAEAWLREGGVIPGLEVVEGETRELSDTYYDTLDWRIYRAGYALRVREGEGKAAEATLKSLASEGGATGAARRREISGSLQGDVGSLRKAKGPLGEHFRAFAGAWEVRPIFTLRTSRRTFDLVVPDPPADGEPEDGRGEIVMDASGDIRPREDGEGVGGRVGEVALDSTEITLGEGEEPARLSRVEVEADASLADAAPGLEEFVAQMRGSLGLKPTTVSKYHAGLFATGQSPEAATYLGPNRVDASLSLGELAFAILRRQFAALRAHEAGSRLGEDPEEVHDMRVATRRLRAAIKLFKGALPERALWIRDELKWVAGALGEVRDLDVQLPRLRELSAGAEEAEEREALSRATNALEKRRGEARERLIEALDSPRYRRFESSFAEMLRRGPTRELTPGGGPAADSQVEEPVLVSGPKLLSRRYRAWGKLAKGVRENSPPESFHDLRKEGKRLRYALEFFAEVYGPEVTDGLVKPLKVVQDDLGDHQDAIVAADLLRELATGGHRFPARAAFAMGILAQRSLQEAEDMRRGLRASEAYHAVADEKAWKGFEKAMEEARRPTGGDKKGKGKKSTGKKKK